MRSVACVCIKQTKGYSGSDLRALSTEAALEPIRYVAAKYNLEPNWFIAGCALMLVAILQQMMSRSDIALKGDIDTMSAAEVHAINYNDFCKAMRQVYRCASRMNSNLWLL